jgi:hypothetical protein
MLPHSIERYLHHHLLDVSCRSGFEAQVLADFTSLVTTERSKSKHSEWTLPFNRSEPAIRKSD